MKLIFCISNIFVPAALTLIHKSTDKNILVYTYDKNILDFFVGLDIKNVTLYFREELFLSKNPTSLYKFLCGRNRILKNLQQYSISEIFFFHNTFGDIENWLLNKLYRKCKVFYFPMCNAQPPVKYSIRALKGILIYNIIHQTKVVPLWTGEEFIFRIANSFFRRIGAKQIQIQIDQMYIRHLIDDKFNINSNLKIILLTGSVVEFGQVEKLEYQEYMDKLISKIGIEKIGAKPHPRFSNRYSLESELILIPSFIPANVLFSKFNIFIGYSTIALTEAANNGCLSISLIDYLKPVSEERRKIFKDYLINNLERGIIHFPKTLESVLNILNDADSNHDKDQKIGFEYSNFKLR